MRISTKTFKICALVILPIVILAIALAPIPASASVGGILSSALRWYFEKQINLLGKLFAMLGESMKPLFSVRQDVLYPSTVRQMWTVMRDFVNLFFILVLVIIAFGTIFNVQKYTYKDLLPKLIIAALLVNFSLVIAQWVIDISNQLSHMLLNIIGNFSKTLGNGLLVNQLQTSAPLDSLDKSTVGKMLNYAPGWHIVKFFIPAAQISISYIIARIGVMILLGIANFIYSIIILILLVRIPFIWALLIFSPFAWLGYTLPATRKIWDKWWRYFMEFTFFPTIMLFFISIALLFIKAKDSFSEVYANPSLNAQIMNLTGIDQMVDILIFIISALMLILGIKYSFAISGSAGKAVSKAGSGVMWAAKRIPIPGTKSLFGARMSYKQAKGVAKEKILPRFEKYGLPESVPLSKHLRKLGYFKGTEQKEIEQEVRADVLAQKLGYAGLQSAQNIGIKKAEEYEDFWNKQAKDNRISVDEKTGDVTWTKQNGEIETFRSDELSSGLIDSEGKLDINKYGLIKSLAKRGVMSPKVFHGTLEKAVERGYGTVAADFMHAMSEGSMKKIPDNELATIFKGGTTESGLNFSFMKSLAAKSAKKELAQYWSSKPGKLSALTMDYDTYKEAVSVLGGQHSNKSWEFRLRMRELRPDLDMKWMYENEKDLNTGRLKYKGLDGIETSLKEILSKYKFAEEGTEEKELYRKYTKWDGWDLHEAALQIQQLREEQAQELENLAKRIAHDKAIARLNFHDLGLAGVRAYEGPGGKDFLAAVARKIEKAGEREPKSYIAENGQVVFNKADRAFNQFVEAIWSAGADSGIRSALLHEVPEMNKIVGRVRNIIDESKEAREKRQKRKRRKRR